MNPLYKQTLYILNIFSLVIAFSLSAQESVSESISQPSFTDDIAIPTRWISDPSHPNPDTIPENLLTNSDGSIRERHYYRPAVVTDTNALIVFIVVHGTWGPKNKSYFEDDDNANDVNDDKKRQHFRHIKRFASQLATVKRKNLELLSLLWSGKLSDSSRQLSGERLRRLMTEVRSYKNAETVLLGHSHGCNIINYYSRIVDEHKPISLLIYFACPRRKEEHNQPLHYKTLLYFYSDSDLTTVLGRANETESVKTGVKWATVVGAAASIKHFKGEKVLCKIPYLNVPIKVAHIMESVISGTTVFTEEKIKELVSGSNDFPGLDDRITVGFRTKINGRNPWHSTIIDVTRFLPEIIEKVLINLPAHYSESSSFHLNVNLQDSINPIYLAPYTKGNVIPPEHIDGIILKNSDGSSKIINVTSIPRRAEKAEGQWADTELDRYENKYKKDLKQSYISEKFW